MTPKRVDKDQKKRQIALVALELFAEHGFGQTSMSQVAAAAGISKGAIYLYFESKADLTTAAAAAWIAQMEGGWVLVPGDCRHPAKRLRTLFRTTTRAFLKNPRMVRLFLGIMESASRDPDKFAHLNLVRRISDPVRKAVCTILEDGFAAGWLRPEAARDAGKIAINLVAFVDGLGLQALGDPGFFDLDQQIDFHIEGLLQSLLLPQQGDQNHE